MAPVDRPSVDASATATTSADLFARAQAVLPGGVNSPVRAFRSVGGSPRFVVRGEGARVRDEDGREYLDFVGAWGPLLFGHAYRPSAARSDVSAFARFFHALLERGIATAPSQFEANFISAAHTAEDIAATVDAMTSALAEVFA